MEIHAIIGLPLGFPGVQYEIITGVRMCVCLSTKSIKLKRAGKRRAMGEHQIRRMEKVVCLCSLDIDSPEEYRIDLKVEREKNIF
jgi:hypothetical protein